jgi:hypothetical protein
MYYRDDFVRRTSLHHLEAWRFAIGRGAAGEETEMSENPQFENDDRKKEQRSHDVEQSSVTRKMQNESVHALPPGDILRAGSAGALANAPLRSEAMHSLQKTHGNQAVQRYVHNMSSSRVSVQREEPSTARRIAGGAWDVLTNDFLGGPVGLLDEASKVTAPLFGSAGAGQLLNRAGNLPGVGVANQILGPIGMVSGAMDVYNALSADDYNMQTWGDVAFKGAGAISGGITTMGLLGSGLTALGGTGVAGSVGAAGALGSAGAGLSGAAAAAAPVGAVLGAGAAGYGIGRMLDNGADWIGDQITGNEGGDHSLSGLSADGMVGMDQAFTRGLRAIGAYDESRPEYTQTLGWRLAEVLPSWLQ